MNDDVKIIIGAVVGVGFLIYKIIKDILDKRNGHSKCPCKEMDEIKKATEKTNEMLHEVKGNQEVIKGKVDQCLYTRK